MNEYKEHKALTNPKQNLRDHMDQLELIFTMLGEKATTEITRVKDAQGFDECKETAKEGGDVAGNARQELELKLGKSIVSKENMLREVGELKLEKKDQMKNHGD